MVVVLAIKPKVRGYKPDREWWTFKGDKIRSSSPFGGEEKPSAPFSKILWHV
jgi:hypothetical protein